MNTRPMRHVLRWLPVAALAACAAYVPPAPLPPQAFSRDLAAPYERVWSAALQAGDTSLLHTEATDRADGSITLGFWTRDPAAYVDCGKTAGGSGGATTPALLGLGFNSAFLEGTAHVEIRPDAAGRATVQVADQYRLGVYRVDPIGVRVQIAEFRFDSASTDTRRVGLGLVTCRASHALERALLDQVAARV